jgi:hypothetical protein
MADLLYSVWTGTPSNILDQSSQAQCWIKCWVSYSEPLSWNHSLAAKSGWSGGDSYSMRPLVGAGVVVFTVQSLTHTTEHIRAEYLSIFHVSFILICPYDMILSPPLWSRGQSSWLQTQRSGFDSWRYQISWEVRLELGPFNLVSTTEELLERKVAAPV